MKKNDEIKRKICSECGEAMVVRERRSGDAAGTKYWVCSKYPNCITHELYKDTNEVKEETLDESDKPENKCDAEPAKEDFDNADNKINSKLIECAACKKTISVNARACPFCGEPNGNTRNKKLYTFIAIGVVSMILIGILILTAKKSQKIIFSADSIKYSGHTVASNCKRACEEYSIDIDKYLSDGYEIIASSPKEIPITNDTTTFTNGPCTCVGTEYILQK